MAIYYTATTPNSVFVYIPTHHGRRVRNWKFPIIIKINGFYDTGKKSGNLKCPIKIPNP